jgi:cation transport ATPase
VGQISEIDVSVDLLVALSTSTSYFASIAMLITDVRAGYDRESVGTQFDDSVLLTMFIQT